MMSWDLPFLGEHTHVEAVDLLNFYVPPVSTYPKENRSFRSVRCCGGLPIRLVVAVHDAVGSAATAPLLVPLPPTVAVVVDPKVKVDSDQ